MEEINKKCLIFLLIGLGLALILSAILLIFKTNFQKSSFIPFFFAYIFLVAYFFQPFLITFDYALFIYESYYHRERNYEEIDTIFTLIYKYVGYTGTGFSYFILPLYRYYYFSGYFKFCERIRHAFKRYWFEYILGHLILIIIVAVIFIASGIIYFAGQKEFILTSIDIVFNCFIIPGIFKTLLYIGSYFPILISELKLICACCRKKNYETILNGVITKSLQKDQKKIAKAVYNLREALNKSFFDEQYQKNEIEKILNRFENNKDTKMIAVSKGDDVGVLTQDTFYDIICNSITEFKETELIIPRKILVKANIKIKIKKSHGNCFCWYPFVMILIGIFILFIEIFGDLIEYSEIKDDYNRIHVNFCLMLLAFLVIYYLAIYFCVLKRNSITEHMLYGKKDSDSLCLLNFATAISGLITPVSFIVIYSNIFGIYHYEDQEKKFYPQQNMIFTRINKYLIIENIKPIFHLDISFKSTFWIYSYSKSFVIILFFIGAFFFHSFPFRACFYCCCNKCGMEKKCYIFKFKFTLNDKNEKFCAYLREDTYEKKGSRDSLQIEQDMEKEMVSML